MACSLPWLSILLPQWLKGPGLDCECYMTWVFRDITNWLSLPAALLLQVHVAFYLGKMGVSMEDWLRIFALTKVQTLISILIWLPVPLSIALTDCCNWLPIALIFILILVNVYVYFIAGHSFCTWRVQKDSASPAKPLPHVPQLQTEQVDVESDPISLDASVLDVDTDKCSTFSIWKFWTSELLGTLCKGQRSSKVLLMLTHFHHRWLPKGRMPPLAWLGTLRGH